MRVCLTFVNVITGAVLCRSISQDALRRAPYSGIAGLHRSRNTREEGVWKSNRWVRVNRLRQDRGLRSEWLVVQAPGHAQVASVLVHTAHVSTASIWQDTALIHIYTLSRPAIISKTFCAGLSVSRLDTKQNKYQSCQHPCGRAKPEATYFKQHGLWFLKNERFRRPVNSPQIPSPLPSSALTAPQLCAFTRKPTPGFH